MERNVEQKKPDLKTWQRHLSLAPPPGDGGGKGATGWAGDLGKQTRLSFRFGAVGVKDACELSRSLPGRRGRRVRAAVRESERDSEAAVLHTTAHCATLYSVQKGTHEWGVSARKE